MLTVMLKTQDWCVTEGMCGSSLGDGQFFDTCAIPTKRGCSCRRSWMTKVCGGHGSPMMHESETFLLPTLGCTIAHAPVLPVQA